MKFPEHSTSFVGPVTMEVHEQPIKAQWINDYGFTEGASGMWKVWARTELSCLQASLSIWSPSLTEMGKHALIPATQQKDYKPQMQKVDCAAAKRAIWNPTL